MGLFITHVHVWNTKRSERLLGKAFGDFFLLNTNRLCDIKASAEGYTQFLYHQAPDDRRCSPDHIECTTSLAMLRYWHDLPETSKFGTLPIFPGFDTTVATVNTTLEWANIAIIWQTPRDVTDGVSHMVYYKEAWKRTLCIVNLNLLAILNLEYL